MKIIKLSEHTETPGGRLIKHGDFSGEWFRNIIETHYKEFDKITIDLDDVYGCPPSFLEECFGGLARTYPINEVLEKIEIISTEDPSLIEEIDDYIRHSRD